MNPESLINLNNLKMPNGKYRGINLIDLPERYVLWCKENEVYPSGLKNLFLELYEIKVNGLEKMVKDAVRDLI